MKESLIKIINNAGSPTRILEILRKRVGESQFHARLVSLPDCAAVDFIIWSGHELILIKCCTEREDIPVNAHDYMGLEWKKPMYGTVDDSWISPIFEMVVTKYRLLDTLSSLKCTVPSFFKYIYITREDLDYSMEDSFMQYSLDVSFIIARKKLAFERLIDPDVPALERTQPRLAKDIANRFLQTDDCCGEQDAMQEYRKYIRETQRLMNLTKYDKEKKELTKEKTVRKKEHELMMSQIAERFTELRMAIDEDGKESVTIPPFLGNSKSPLSPIDLSFLLKDFAATTGRSFGLGQQLENSSSIKAEVENADNNNEFEHEGKEYPEENQKTCLSLAKLDGMVGLSAVKEKISRFDELNEYNQLAEKFGISPKPLNLHAIFLGNPGTGKTTVAKLWGDLLHHYGLLSKGDVIKCSRTNLIGNNWGDEEVILRNLLEKSEGNVLFIDEAYSLISSERPDDPGRKVLEDLLEVMADPDRRNISIILAGYTRPMQMLLDTNPGLRSRFPEQNILVFEDLSEEQLVSVALNQISSDGYLIEYDAEQRLREIIHQGYVSRDPESFGNARWVENLLEHCYLEHVHRIISMKRDKEDREFLYSDIVDYILDDVEMPPHLSPIVDVKAQQRDLSLLEKLSFCKTILMSGKVIS